MFEKVDPLHNNMTVIFRAAGLWEAEVIKGRLEASGFSALLDYESVGPIYGLTMDGLGEVRILVSSDQAEDALLLLSSQDPDPSLTNDPADPES